MPFEEHPIGLNPSCGSRRFEDSWQETPFFLRFSTPSEPGRLFLSPNAYRP